MNIDDVNRIYQRHRTLKERAVALREKGYGVAAIEESLDITPREAIDLTRGIYPYPNCPKK